MTKKNPNNFIDFASKNFKKETVSQGGTHVYELTSSFSMIINDKGIIRQAGYKILNWLGFNEDELIGKYILEFLDIADDKRYLENLFGQIKNNQLSSFELKIKSKVEQSINFFVNSSSFTKKGEKYFSWSLYKIIGKVNTAKGIIQSEYFFRSIWNNANDGMRVLDDKGNIIDVNDSFCKMVGLEKKKLINNHFSIIYTGEEYFTNGNEFEEDEKLNRYEKKIHLWNGEKIWCEIVKFKIELIDHPRMILTIFHNISARKQVEENLRESENRLDLALKSAQLGMWDWDVKAGEILINEQWAKILGFSIHEVDTKAGRWEKLVHPEDYESLKKALDDHLNGVTDIYEHEYRVKTKSGKWIWVHDEGKIVKHDERGNPLRITGTYKDISERKRREKDLEKSNRSLEILSLCNIALVLSENEKSLYETVSNLLHIQGGYEFVWIGNIYSEGHDKYKISPIITAGYGSECLENLKCLELGDSNSDYDCHMMKAIKNQKASFSLKRNENLICSEALKKYNFNSSVSIPIIINRAITGVVNIYSQKENAFDVDEIQFLNDLTNNLAFGINSFKTKEQRLKVEKELIEEKENLSVTLSSIAEGVITTDLGGKIILANKSAERILEIEQKELIGKQIFEVINIIEQNLDSLYPAYSVQKRIAKDFESEKLIIKTPRDNRKIISSSSSSSNDYAGSAKGFVFVIKDITELVEIENKLALSQKLESIGQLAAGIAHEINTPMQYIGDNTEFLKNTFKTLEDYITFLTDTICNNLGTNVLSEVEQKKNQLDIDFIKEEIPSALNQSKIGIERVSNIVLAMKRFSHKNQKAKAPSDINSGIEVTATISRNEWKYFADLNLKLNHDLPLVNCNIDEVNQIILNMIINAAHAIEQKIKNEVYEKGEIIISTSCVNDFCKIEIEDNGIGIPGENIDRIFEPFFTTKDVGKGTGQGLAIAHDIVINNHKGDIKVKTEYGKGSVFTILIPINQ